MPEPEIVFDDSVAYERGVGVWSRLAGQEFLAWLEVGPGLRWLDVGCGSGAFTDLVAERCAPKGLTGIDPSPAQVAFARQRLSGPGVAFLQGDSMALPFAADSFDVAVMALVIFFVPEPARGVAEMVRVVRPGGLVASYSWAIEDRGLPAEPFHAQFRAIGIEPLLPPSVAASHKDALPSLWREAGLVDIRSRSITVARSFDGFDDFWETTVRIPGLSAQFAALTPQQQREVRAGVQAGLPSDAAGRISYASQAHAIAGRVPPV